MRLLEDKQWTSADIPDGRSSDGFQLTASTLENLSLSLCDAIYHGKELRYIWCRASSGGYLRRESVIFRTALRSLHDKPATLKDLRRIALDFAVSTADNKRRSLLALEALYTDDSGALSEMIIKSESLVASRKEKGPYEALNYENWFIGYDDDAYVIVEAGVVARWRLSNGLVAQDPTFSGG